MGQYIRRFIDLDMYKYNVKKQKKGYSKIEVRDDKCKIQIYVNDVTMGENEILKAYMFKYDKGTMKGILLGTLDIKHNIGQLKVLTDQNNIMQSNMMIEDLSGIVLLKKDIESSKIKDDLKYGGTWDEQLKINISNFSEYNKLKEKDQIINKSIHKDIEQKNEELSLDIEEISEPKIIQSEIHNKEIDNDKVLEQQIVDEEYNEENIEDYKYNIDNKNIKEDTIVEEDEFQENEEREDEFYENEEQEVEHHKNEVEDMLESENESIYKNNIKENKDENDYILSSSKSSKEFAMYDNENFYDNIYLKSKKEKVIQNINEVQKKENYTKYIENNNDNYIKDIIKHNKDNITKLHDDDIKELKTFMFKNYPKMAPFESNNCILDCIRIEPKDIAALPINIWMLMNNTFLLSGYNKYKHLILFKEEDPIIEIGYKYVLGVPGIYHKKDRFIAYLYGFERFKCCADTFPKPGEYGYWTLEVPINE